MAESEAEVEDALQLNDFALADSFINFDYEPDMPPQHDNKEGSDPIAVGSGSSRGEEPECENSGNLGCASIEEGVQKISLVGIGGNGDVSDEIIANNEDNKDESESESSESESSGTSSSSSSTCSASSSASEDDDEEEEERRDKKREVEEGEIVDSDAIDNHDDDDDDDDRGEDSEEMASWGIVNDDDEGDDDDGGGGGNRAAGRPIRSKNELEALPLVPPVNVTLEPHHQMLPVGVVMSILGAKVIVEGVEKHDPLNEGSILWMTESRTPLGLIDEIFGPVKNPYYVVRYNSENEVPEGIRGGTLISFVPDFANHVLNNNKDLYKKGYDASGLYDEEVSDETDFSDDEKEAEYRRMQRMTKRGINDQNPGKRKNNRKKVPPKEGVVPTFPVAPATPLLHHEHCSPFSGIGLDLLGATTVVSPFPPANAGPNLTTSGVWSNGTTLPQPPSALLPNGFPTNGVSWYPENTQLSHQLPVLGIPFQQQLNPNHGFPPATMFPGVQPNIFAQPIYAQGLVGQNQMTFGLSSPFSQIRPPINLHSSSVPGNQHTPHQFNPGASANHGRKTFHQWGRKGWQPAK